MSDKIVIDRRLCLTEDGSRVVDESDPAARWLWAIPGHVVDREEAERLGAIEPEQPESDVEPPKKRTPAANKAAKPEENKGGLTITARPRRS